MTQSQIRLVEAKRNPQYHAITRPARASCPEAELKKKRDELSEEKRKKEQNVIANRCLMQQLAKARKELGQEVLGPFLSMLESFSRRHAEH